MTIGVLWMLVIGPNGKKLTDRTTQIATKSEELAKAQDLVQNESKTDEKLDEKKAELGILEATMADGDLYFWMNERLESFQRKYGFEVEIPNVEREQKIDVGVFPDFAYGGVKYTVSGSAFYHELGKFFASFENENPYIRLQNLDIKPMDSLEGDTGDKLSFRMEIVALRKPQGDSE